MISPKTIRNFVIKGIFNCIFSFCLGAGGHAQTVKHEISVDLSAGLFIPVGKFADKDFSGTTLSDHPSGLAKPGPGVSLSGRYGVSNSFGIVALTGFSENNQDKTSFEKYLKQTYGNDKRTEVKTNNWKIIRIMAGCYYLIPVSKSKKIFFEAKASGGLCKTTIPAYSYTVTDANGNFLGNSTNDKIKFPWSFCFQLSSGLNFRLNDKMDLVTNLNYFGSQPVYKYTRLSGSPPTGPPVAAKSKYNIALLGASVGINIDL